MRLRHDQRRHRGIAPAMTIVMAFALAAPSLLFAGGGNNAGGSAQGQDSRSFDVQLLAINDFHGNLEPPTGSSGRIATAAGNVNAGGVEYLATHIKELRATNPNTITVSAGDNIGASPLISGYFHDEPTIEALNALGLDISAVGNHEFDEGIAELQRMQNGGCHPVDGCQDGDPFTGANFQFLAANVVDSATGKTVFPAYKIEQVNGVRIGFIGLTLEGTPSIVTPAGVAGLTFLDEAETVNKYARMLQKNNVEAIVVLIHEGGVQAAPSGSATSYINDCNGVSGAIVNIVNSFDPTIDVVVSGHTHQAYNCTINNKLVTSGSSFGRLVTDIDLRIDRASHDIVSASAENTIVTRDVTRDAGETALVTKYGGLIADIKNQVVGSLADPAGYTRTNNSAGESQLGDIIADAQLAATAAAPFDAQIAFMNPGGIRADLPCLSPGCPVTFGDLFGVQPFNNDLVTMKLTGAQIKTLLEQQFDNPLAGQRRILQVSDGFSYDWSTGAAVGSKISNMMLNGSPIVAGTTYDVTVNSFLAGGGDRFFVLRDGTDKRIGPVDLTALVNFFGANSPIPTPPQNRITMVP